MSEHTEFSVSGMMCGGCESNVETELSELAGVERVEADHESDSVTIVADSIDRDTVAAAVADAGYELTE